MTNNLFTAKLKKGDVLGAITQSKLEADNAKAFAKKAVSDLDLHQQRIDDIANAALAKYPVL